MGNKTLKTDQVRGAAPVRQLGLFLKRTGEEVEGKQFDEHG